MIHHIQDRAGNVNNYLTVWDLLVLPWMVNTFMIKFHVVSQNRSRWARVTVTLDEQKENICNMMKHLTTENTEYTCSLIKLCARFLP